MKSPRHPQIFVLIDALGWNLLQELGADFLTGELPFRRPLRTLLGFSSGVIPSILSGLLPAESGIWNLVYYDPETSPFRWLRHFSFLPLGLLDNRVGRRLMSELGRRVLGLGPGFDCCVEPRLLPWFNWAERDNIYQRGGLGSVPSIFDQLSEAGVPYRVYSYRQGTSDAQILAAAEKDVAGDPANFFFIYLCELDMFLHIHRGDREAILAKLQWYETGLRRVLAAAGRRDPEASLAVFSDHGMTPVSNLFDLAAEVDACGLKSPDDYLVVYDSTMARFWFRSDAGRAKLLARLCQVPCGRLLSDQELDALGILFPDRRYGEAILLMDPGAMIAVGGFNGNGWKPVGMHGFHPDDADSDAVFLANRAPASAPTTVRDVYRLMREATA